MPFEIAAVKPQKIAVIGAGISGMGAALRLADRHEVVLFEAENRLGGHARTKMAGRNEDVSVDTGFIVFNYANYPHLTALFDELDVPVTESNMSFGASINGGAFEYGLTNLNAVFAQKRNAFKPWYLAMIRDIFKFNKHGLELAKQHPQSTIGEFLKKLGTGDAFREYYLLPLSGAIWSTPTEKILDFPAHAMMQFFENHALLNYTGQHQWFTVEGGSIEYVKRVESALQAKGVELRLGTPIQSVERGVLGPRVKTHGSDWEGFDQIVFATHSDDSLRLLSDASEHEHRALSAVKYQPNDIVLHSDTSIMPKKRAVWASWVYTENQNKRSDQIDLTYWMNNLQPIKSDQDFMVTLNTTRPIREDLIWDQVTLRHPVYDLAALEAQKIVASNNGANKTWFCGAWMKNGFHEDGLSSGLDVAESILAQDAMAMAAE